MLSEVSQDQKHKGHVFSHTWKMDPKINTYTKQAQSYTNPDVERVCNSGTALWNSGKEGREKRVSVKLHNIRCEGRRYKDVY
jgi:hypothetical protein